MVHAYEILKNVEFKVPKFILIIKRMFRALPFFSGSTEKGQSRKCLLLFFRIYMYKVRVYMKKFAL